ncbi:MAG: hypothetical protein J1E64_01840 [Acetatifactor sp.]|nr:hypothetical protein [Acetatifactor sp.]
MARSNHVMTKKDNYVDGIFFVLLLVAVSALTFILFYRQAIYCWESGSPYPSDMKAYILEMQGLDSGYSFPYPIFFKVGAFFHLFVDANLSVALATMLLNALAILLTKLAMDHLVLDSLETAFPGRRWLAGIIVSVAVVSLFFVSMLFPPEGIYLPGIQFHYLGVFTGNPFHNATYIAARPFAILAFLWYIKLLDLYEEGFRGNWRDYLLFSLFLLLTTMTKPSFTIVLVGVAGLIMIYRLVRARFHNFVPTLQLGICFVPTFLDLLYQYRGVFVPEEGAEGGIGFSFGEVWGLYCSNIPLAVCLAVGFPILVFLLHWREWRSDTFYRFSWQVYGMSFAMAFFLYEKGFRKPDFNFAWGYLYGIFFAFLGALVFLLKDTARLFEAGEDTGTVRVGRFYKVCVCAEWLAYLWHLACGLYYFWKIFNGQMYY